MMDGKVAVITGSGRGIGRHIAKTFADAGADVVVADIVPLDTVEREIQERGVQALAVPTDVRSEEQVQSLVNATMEKFGRIDVLVNNAAIVTHFLWGLPRWPRVRDMEKEFWDKVIGTNLGGTFLCTKYVLPHMEAQRSGTWSAPWEEPTPRCSVALLTVSPRTPSGPSPASWPRRNANSTSAS